MTVSGMNTDLEKQIVFHAKRLIRVRNVRGNLSRRYAPAGLGVDRREPESRSASARPEQSENGGADRAADDHVNRAGGRAADLFVLYGTTACGGECGATP
jgi:hypothetical protein